MSATTSQKLFERACSVIPGGVNSPVRAWKAVGGSPLFIQRAKGSLITDVDGNSFVDYVCSWGPLILGHAHPKVVQSIQDAMRDGTSFGAPTPGEVELATVLRQAFPSIEQVRLVSSGTEAGMTALRLARAFTGRSKIIKFAGCYHGHSDALLVRAGSGGMTFGVPDSAGVNEALARETLVADFNALEQVEDLFRRNPDSIAAVIVEPVVGNMGVVCPEPGFLAGLRRITEGNGTLLIFDEVITGFRVAYGGVQTLEGLRPDLTCLGKVVGGGLPLAAIGGRAEVMSRLAPLGPVYQAGTLSGNPLAVAAGLATLEQLREPGVYERLEELGAELQRGLSGALERHGLSGCVSRVGSMWTLFFGVERVRDLPTVQRCDAALFARFFRGMLEQGIYLPPSAFEAAFISLAHGESDIELTVRAADRVIGALRPV